MIFGNKKQDLQEFCIFTLSYGNISMMLLMRHFESYRAPVRPVSGHFAPQVSPPPCLYIRIRIRNLYCPYFTEKHQGTRKYINKDIWIPTHYKQTKTLSENTKQWYKIIEYNVERKWQWNDLYTLWYIPQAIAAIIHPEDTEPDEGTTAVKRYNRIDYELIGHSYGTVVHYVPSG